MTLDADLHARSGAQCELCGGADDLAAHTVPPHDDADADHTVLLCATCRGQIETPDTTDVHHWRCLGDSMWTPVPAVQVMAWRMLNHLHAEPWARDLLDTLYLDDETLAWAQQGIDASQDDTVQHRDSNGATLTAGDTVTLIKDLPVKGANFTAKRGTAVRNISLVPDNAAHIEGRVNGQHIVILTEFVKKSS